jgi:uncharacterized protein DUF3300
MASTYPLEIAEAANPQVVYIPTYNPTAVYGAWPYPAYPPYADYPPGYVAATSLFPFGVGVAVGSALWGNCNWGRGDVDINVNNYNNFNKTNITNAKWEHHVEHRKGVQYRDSATQQKFNRTTRTGGDAREAFRGRAERGRQELAHGGAEGVRRDLEQARSGAKRSGAGGRRHDVEGSRLGGERQEGLGSGRRGDRQTAQGRQDIGARDRQSTDRPRQADAFQGIGNGREVRRDSERGFASRQSAVESRAAQSVGSRRSAGAGSGGQFSGGGGGRAGGRGGGSRGR